MKNYIFFIFVFTCSILKGQTAYQHTTVSGNVVNSYMTTLTHPNLDGNKEAIIIIMPKREQGRNDFYTKNYGVWYDLARRKWAIFTEDRTAMPIGLTFNVLVMTKGQNAFTIKADPQGVANHGFGHGTLFSNDATNNKKDAIILVVHNGGDGNQPISNNNSLLVDYSEAHNQWGIAHNDFMAYFVGLTESVNSFMRPNNAVFPNSNIAYSFNVVVFKPDSSNAFVHTVETCNSNRSNNKGYFTSFINNANMIDANKIVFATPNWRTTGPYNESPICVQYGTPRNGFFEEKKWSIINANTNALPQGMKFNVAFFNSN